MRKHGTISCYVGGCRCDACGAAWRDYYRNYRARNPAYREAERIRLRARRHSQHP